MKGKIILVFVFALIALTLVGFVGRNTLTQLIISIKKESSPNVKLAYLEDILSDLSNAESSVRTYTITQNSENLIPFYESAASFDNNMKNLYSAIKSKEQMKLADSIESLIGEKYLIMKQLIDIKKDQDTDKVLQRVLANIELLRDRDSVPEMISIDDYDLSDVGYDRIKKVDIPETPEPAENRSWFQRLFGKNSPNDEKEDEDIETTIAAKPKNSPDTVYKKVEAPITKNTGKDISSKDIGNLISQIGREENQNLQAIKAQELKLTIQDEQVMRKVRKLAAQFEEREKKASINRAQTAEKATDRATNFITITWFITLGIFAFLLFIIFNDIARNQKNKDRLRKAKDNAEKLARVKEEFLSNMSHEIRTPLNSIIGFTEQLASTPLQKDQHQYLNSIQRSGSHLLRLINDILDYAKLESGKLSMESIGFRMRESIANIIASFEVQLAKKQLQINSVIDPEIPEILVGDPVRFEQILINLVSNAIKFTEDGQIDIEIKHLSTEENVCFIELMVKDSGIGIPEHKLGSIFKDFSQVDSSVTRKYGGTGLGLSIVKKIIKQIGGDISVRSKVGEGTSFIIHLNYKVGTSQDLSHTKKSNLDTSAVRGCKIMVVDDQEYNLELISVIFDKWQIQGTLLNSGKDAIEAFKQDKFDLIFMDMQMPEMSGVEAVRKIRSIETGERTTIIALTAATSQEEANECLQAGMDDCLLKPFTQKELYNTIVAVLGTGDKATADDNENSAETKGTNSLDLTDLYELADGDPNFVVNMLEIYIKNFSADLEQMESAVAQQDIKKAGSKAHKMIPPTRHLGFQELVTILKKIETKSENEENFNEIQRLLEEVKSLYQVILPHIKSEIAKQKESEPLA
ncbi:ATP-binding protein [Fulvivirga ligni]|uniref:ATP-binding protein n=1 Tax=Fulvivirga ligni TaxID=2904246 RepID=UPI001F46A0BB|nr:ATP-binding protein [Fulvivirga ligni]UII21125.1 ATP-binding protein [Fulvivirga ligni]